MIEMMDVVSTFCNNVITTELRKNGGEAGGACYEYARWERSNVKTRNTMDLQ